MRSRGQKQLRVFPEFLDADLSRRDGRRVPKKIAVSRPLADEIRLAAEHLGYAANVREGAYPRRPWDPRNLVLVEKREKTKTRLMQELAKDIETFVRPAIEEQRREQERERQKKKFKPQVGPIFHPSPSKKDDKIRRRR